METEAGMITADTPGAVRCLCGCGTWFVPTKPRSPNRPPQRYVNREHFWASGAAKVYGAKGGRIRAEEAKWKRRGQETAS
jgi:hypothetical protein